VRVYFGLGSNIDPERNLPAGIARLGEIGTVRAVSRIYRSPPQGGARGPAFLNAAVELETDLEPEALTSRRRALEVAMGRAQQAFPGCPRTIDLDLLWGAPRGPHPDLLRYAHAVVPLSEIAPHLVHPATGETLAEIAARLRAGADLVAIDPGR